MIPPLPGELAELYNIAMIGQITKLSEICRSISKHGSEISSLYGQIRQLAKDSGSRNSGIYSVLYECGGCRISYSYYWKEGDRFVVST